MSATWNPGDLTGLAATLLPAESLAGGLLWQNTAKTVPATADGDPVRVAVCPYTAVEFTAPSDAARPLLWDEGGGLWSLAFDGVDDYLSASVSWTGTSGSLGVRFTRSSGTLVPLVQTLPAADDDWYSFSGLAYAHNFRTARLDAFRSVTLDTSPHTCIQQSGSVSGYKVYEDGTQVGTAAATWQSPTSIRVATNKGPSGYLSGRISGFITVASEWDATVRGQVETYLGAL